VKDLFGLGVENETQTPKEQTPRKMRKEKKTDPV
jgi:hypothetical protein